MAHRFTDTEKWFDPWFSELPQLEQLFWIFILDRCDHAGVWKVSWKTTEGILGGKPDMALFEKRLVRIAPDKIFIPKFLVFQYGHEWQTSKQKCMPSVIKLLKSYGILGLAHKLTLPKAYPVATQGLPKAVPNDNNDNDGNDNDVNNGNDNDRMSQYLDEKYDTR